MISSNKKRFNSHQLFTIAWKIIRFVIIFGLAFIILKPLVYKIIMAFMTREDLLNPSVNMIPLHPSFEYWKMAWNQMSPSTGFLNTAILSLSVGVLQVVSCTMIGYGLGRFNFRGRNLAFIFVVLIMLVPFNAVSTAQYLRFVFFGIGDYTINLLDTFFPVFILAFTGTNLKNGLYIYLMREFFQSMPGNLEEAAYIDGCGPIRTFIKVIVPNARGMITTVFLFSFCWQWTDSAYARSYFSDVKLIGNVFSGISAGTTLETTIVRNAAAVIAMVPLIIIFLVFQKTLVKSISRSGMAN